MVVHKISKKEIIIADLGVGIVKLKPEEFFGETLIALKPEPKPPVSLPVLCKVLQRGCAA